MPKQYAAEFRQGVLALHRSGRSVAALSEESGVSQAAIYKWIKQDEVDRGESPGISSVESSELTAARRRIRQLEEELEITRKASEIFERQKLAPKASTR